MALPSDYSNEIRALDREVLKNKPSDLLQFCANFFLRRLESQRAEFLLSQRHSNQSGMAENSFPGNNPFGGTSPAASPGHRGMHSVAEEEENDFASPTASSFPANARNNVNPNASSSGGAFGNFGFSPAAGSQTSPPDSVSAGAMDVPHSLPSNYNVNRRTSVSAESLAPSSADDAHWKAPTYPKTEQQESRLRSAVAHNFLFSHLDDEQTDQVLAALQERKLPAKDMRIIVQGDAGDYFYIVESGNFDIYVSKAGHVEPGRVLDALEPEALEAAPPIVDERAQRAVGVDGHTQIGPLLAHGGERFLQPARADLEPDVGVALGDAALGHDDAARSLGVEPHRDAKGAPGHGWRLGAGEAVALLQHEARLLVGGACGRGLGSGQSAVPGQRRRRESRQQRPREEQGHGHSKARWARGEACILPGHSGGRSAPGRHMCGTTRQPRYAAAVRSRTPADPPEDSP